MDLFFVKYDLREEMESNSYSWQEILFALKHKIITADDVIKYATCIINEDTLGFEIVIEIACLSDNEDIFPYLEQLVSLEITQEISGIKDKWLYLILKWLYKKRKFVVNALDMVEEIYEIFDYPDSIISFVRYMPSESGDLGSVELNRERLYKNWAYYLEQYEEEHFDNILNP